MYSLRKVTQRDRSGAGSPGLRPRSQGASPFMAGGCREDKMTSYWQIRCSDFAGRRRAQSQLPGEKVHLSLVVPEGGVLSPRLAQDQGDFFELCDFQTVNQFGL